MKSTLLLVISVAVFGWAAISPANAMTWQGAYKSETKGKFVKICKYKIAGSNDEAAVTVSAYEICPRVYSFNL
ncbi:hypothetical protein DID95_03510 [Vibrio fluvialis]|jgi:hypothetical protein|uniref:hypothetical protein n=1 Tax=Vibrio fluvialis TaxID=676 RepID=UPI000571A0B1|nr:hypothetical protein [Vibrio fluvialis]EKO3966627.1 hypothetical protein [Vibrio fluvialis]EKO3981363.1 hypothetical protein [Vibrio fluvialis]TRN08203.1 hypothetical protein DM586_18825 [Vibrio fluvialis]